MKSTSARLRRHHACIVACAAAMFVGASAVWLNAWRQRAWLAYHWRAETNARLAIIALAALVAGAAVLRLTLAWKRGAWTSTNLAPARWVFTAAVLSWIAAWRASPTAPKQDALAAFAVAAGLWCACMLFSRLHDRELPPRWARVLDFGLFQIAACVLAGELTLRGVRAVTQHPMLLTAGGDADIWIREHRQTPGRFRFGFPINSDGFVDSELSKAPRPAHLVACIGDSFSVGVVPHDRHYTSVAESAFTGLEVYNIGVVNAGPREYRRMLERYARPLAPDLIVIALFLGNDVVDARRRSSSALSAWCDRNEMLAVQAPRRAYALMRERNAATMLGDIDGANCAFTIPSTLELSPDQVTQRLPWLDDALSEPQAMSSERFTFVESTRALDTARVGLSDYGDLIAAIDELRSAAAPIPLAFVLIPDEFQVEDALWNAIERAQRDTVFDRNLPQKIVGEELARRGLACVDLLPELRSVAPLSDGRRHVYHLCDTHFNTRGNALAGRALAELIERCGVARRN